jgi:hypothetical protein
MNTPHQLTLRVTDRFHAKALQNRLCFGQHLVGMGPIKLMRWNETDDGWDRPAKLTFELIEGAPKPYVTGIFEALQAAGPAVEQLLVDEKATTVSEARKRF